MSLADRLRETRKRAGLTQTDFASALGISLATVRRWEGGKTAPDGNQIGKIARLLETTGAYLMGEATGPEKDAPMFPLRDNRLPVLGRAVELPVYSLTACMGNGFNNEGEARERVGTAWLDERVIGPLGPVLPYLINADGTSMEPKIHEGDRLVVNENLMPGAGDICLARFMREGWLRDAVKYYYPGPRGGFTLKSSESSGIPPLEISHEENIAREAFVVGRIMYIDRGESV